MNVHINLSYRRQNAERKNKSERKRRRRKKDRENVKALKNGKWENSISHKIRFSVILFCFALSVLFLFLSLSLSLSMLTIYFAMLFTCSTICSPLFVYFVLLYFIYILYDQIIRFPFTQTIKTMLFIDLNERRAK